MCRTCCVESKWVCEQIKFPCPLDQSTATPASAGIDYKSQKTNVPKSTRPSSTCAQSHKRQWGRSPQKWRSISWRIEKRFHCAANCNAANAHTRLSATNKISVTVAKAACLGILCYNSPQYPIRPAQQVGWASEQAWIMATISENDQGIGGRVSRLG